MVKRECNMKIFGALYVLMDLAAGLVLAVILFGPSVSSVYDNWQTRRGLK